MSTQRIIRNTQMSESNDPERERGIYTALDREFIRGETDYDGQDRRNARYRVRERTKNALRDLSLVLDLEDRDWRRVRESLSDDEREEIADAAAELAARLTGEYDEQSRAKLHTRLHEVEERLADLEGDDGE